MFSSCDSGNSCLWILLILVILLCCCNSCGSQSYHDHTEHHGHGNDCTCC